MGAEVGFKRIMDEVEIDMDELIRRSDAIKVIEAEEYLGYVECQSEWLYDRINAIPSAGRPQGEWIDNGDRYFRCSLCGTKDTDKWYWCHGCGHPMKGADDDD